MTVNTNNGYHPTPDPDDEGPAAKRQTTFQLDEADLTRVGVLQRQRQARAGSARKVARAEILREMSTIGLDVLEAREMELQQAAQDAQRY